MCFIAEENFVRFVIVKRSIFANVTFSTETKKIDFTTWFDRCRIPVPYFCNHEMDNTILFSSSRTSSCAYLYVHSLICVYFFFVIIEMQIYFACSEYCCCSVSFCKLVNLNTSSVISKKELKVI